MLRAIVSGWVPGPMSGRVERTVRIFMISAMNRLAADVVRVRDCRAGSLPKIASGGKRILSLYRLVPDLQPRHQVGDPSGRTADMRAQAVGWIKIPARQDHLPHLRKGRCLGGPSEIWVENVVGKIVADRRNAAKDRLQAHRRSLDAYKIG